MKKILHSFFIWSTILAFAIGFVHCNKVNDFIRDLHDCEVRQYNYSIIEQFAPYLYKKNYDQSGRIVEQIDFTFLAVGVPALKHYLVRHSQKKLLFIDIDNLMDTVMIVQFNAHLRPETIVTSGGLFNLQIKFLYKNNRLDSIRLSDPFGGYKCEYDDNGNILAIKQFSLGHGQYLGTFYQYDYSRTIKAQVYHDEAVGQVDFPFVILKYLDLFPELNPKNARIKSRVGLENGPVVSEFILFNHMVDADGKLTRYEVATIFGQTVAQVNLDWKCNNDNVHHSQ